MMMHHAVDQKAHNLTSSGSSDPGDDSLRLQLVAAIVKQNLPRHHQDAWNIDVPSSAVSTIWKRLSNDATLNILWIGMLNPLMTSG